MGHANGYAFCKKKVQQYTQSVFKLQQVIKSSIEIKKILIHAMLDLSLSNRRT